MTAPDHSGHSATTLVRTRSIGPMTDSLPEPPELDPGALAASEFTRSRRGLEPTEVRAALGRAADALRTWEERDLRLRERLDELEQRLDESHDLDEQRIATVLGEETARIVTAARDAAAEIRAKAEEQAERLIRESEEQATAASEALRGEAQALRDDAARLQADAAAEAEELRSSARAEAERVRAEADAAAATQREEAAALATATVSDAQSHADDLLSAAELVLSERTGEADALPPRSPSRLPLLQLRPRQQRRPLLEEADAYAAATRQAADDAAAAVRADADAVAVSIVEATERGRSMVAEARAVRERMLSDLAQRRRAARRQLEGAVAGRDRIVEILRAATDEVAGTIAGLERADDEAAVAADAAAAEVGDDLDGDLEELRAELSEDIDDDHPFVDAIGVDVGPAEPASDDDGATLVAVAEVVELERSDTSEGVVIEEASSTVVEVGHARQRRRGADRGPGRRGRARLLRPRITTSQGSTARSMQRVAPRCTTCSLASARRGSTRTTPPPVSARTPTMGAVGPTTGWPPPRRRERST